jgi:hypothetical protein
MACKHMTARNLALLAARFARQVVVLARKARSVFRVFARCQTQAALGDIVLARKARKRKVLTAIES